MADAQESLCRALVESLANCIAFLELSDDDIVDPDSAITRMELVASLLGNLPAPAKDLFKKMVADLAKKESKAKGKSKEFVEFLQDWPESMGLEEEEAKG